MQKKKSSFEETSELNFRKSSSDMDIFNGYQKKTSIKRMPMHFEISNKPHIKMSTRKVAN